MNKAANIPKRLFCFSLLAAASIAGCESGRSFIKPGASEEEIHRDFQECAYQSITEPATAAMAQACGYGDGDPFFRCPPEVRQRIQSQTNRCMQGRWYTVEY